MAQLREDFWIAEGLLTDGEDTASFTNGGFDAVHDYSTIEVALLTGARGRINGG